MLGVAGVVLILAGTLDLDEPTTPSLPPITTPSPSPVARTTPTPRPSATVVASPTPAPTPEPMPSSVTAAQLELPSVGINVLVRQSQDAQTDSFPPTDAAYLLRAGNQPGRNTNAYLFAHALNSLFKPLWNVQIGAEVLVRMSDDTVLRYVVTEVRPNVACPDPNATQNNPPNPPLALQIHETCEQGASWTASTDHERLTLQTSQGFNRNWGELVVVAEPVD